MEDITYDKITVCHFKLERMEGLIDSYIIHIYKLPEMDDVVFHQILDKCTWREGDWMVPVPKC